MSRPRRKESMLDRAFKYARLHEGGMSAVEISKKHGGENEVTIFKLIRMANAPKSIHALIRKKKVPATTVQNLLKSSMTDAQMIAVVQAEVDRRNNTHDQLEQIGFRGASSMTARRAINVALDNLRKRRLIKSEGQKAIARCLNEIFGKNGKPSVDEIQSAILAN